MNQIDILLEATIDPRFQTNGARPVAFMLAGFAREGEQFSVVYNAGAEMFLTTLITVDASKGILTFDCSGSQEANRGLLKSERNVFVGKPGGVLVQFTVGSVTEVMFGGSKAFSVTLPKMLIRLQRREYFRIETPRVKPLQFFGRLPSGQLLSLPAHDISVAGIGLTAAILPEGLEFGLVLENCRFVLPDESTDLFFTATLRHLSEFELRAGVHQWRVGLQFNRLSGNDENRIQRYIGKLERERHELA